MTGSQASDWNRILIEQVGQRGMESAWIPHYLRVLSNSIFVRPEESHTEINEHMHHIGWGEIEIDYRLFELAKACLGKGLQEGVPVS